MKSNAIVSYADWLPARKALLEKEKQLSRLRDQISAERRTLPWVKIEKPYAPASARGRVSLADLFAAQLIVYNNLLRCLDNLYQAIEQTEAALLSSSNT